ncbi:dienelactone hydrolase family protein [Phenylobacterium sp.]|uniref:dienelactone hydrolase family protein n=1 Tax=Phenylobacterium sp. TaxID=1871053 RepID=UPI002B850C63|nr:dienelactone hydrolase family protein [Phenylobacterium sp.]HLZ74501.1 dienelactone hydrolase family protein [Phenylobacterium sp.]
MCDDEIHQGLVDPSVSRRAFGLSAAAAATLAATLSATMAHAQENVEEKDVDVKTPDGTADAVLFYPKGKGKWPAVLIWTDIFGLRPVFRDMGRRLAAQGYVVLVPNPFYRQGRAAAVGADKFDFSKPEERAKLMPIAASITGPNTVESDAPAFFAFLDAQPQTDKKKGAGTQGYCMGGPLVYRTAAVLPERIKGAVTCHGGGLVTQTAASPHLLIPKMKAEVYSAVAANDDQRAPTDKDVLKKAFADAGKKATVLVYDGCQHGWCVKGSAVYNEAGAEKAWAELTALYKRNLV